MTQNNDWVISCKSDTIYVLDTSVLVYNPAVLNSLGEAQLVIPLIVLEELDGLRKQHTATGKHAREVIRRLSSFFIHEENPDDLNIIVQFHPFSTSFGYNIPDNMILEVCIKLRENNPDKKVSLVTKDLNLGIKAKLNFISTRDYIEEALTNDGIYTGQTSIILDDNVFEDFFLAPVGLDIFAYLTKEEISSLLPNISVVVCKKSNPKSTGLAVYKNGNLVRLPDFNKPVMNIRPRNKEQRFAMNMLLDDDIKIVSLAGQAGTGKTLLTMAAALHQVVEKQKYERVIVSRPTHPVGKDIGFLPGDVEEKMAPWAVPIKDAVEVVFGGGRNARKQYEDLIYQGFLSVEPLTYIRGRSIAKSLFILDEAQNTTRLEIKTAVSRMGEGSKMVITGDFGQIDNPFIDLHNNGLTQLIERLKWQRLSGHITLEKGERSEIATIAATLL